MFHQRLSMLACCVAILACSRPGLCRQTASDASPKPAVGSGQTKVVLDYQPFAGTEIPVVRVWLNDKVEASFTVDTGSNNCFITDTMAARLGLTPHPFFNSDGKPITDGDRQAQAVSLSLRLGHFVPSGQFVVLGHDRMNLGLGDATDGVIGLNMLSMVETLFDFPQHQITLFRPGSLSAAERAQIGMQDAAVLSSVSTKDFVFAIPVRLNDTATANIILDTGSAVTHIDASILEPLHLAPARVGVKFQTIQGESLEDAVEVEKLETGSLLLRKQKLFSWNKAPIGLGGLLGMDVLARYRVLLDYGARKVYLKPTAKAGEIVAPASAQSAPRIAAVMPLETLAPDVPACVRLTLDDGKPYLFVLDLGLSFSPLDHSVAEQTKLSIHADKDEAGNAMQILRTFVHPTTLTSIVPAGASFPNMQVPFTVYDLSVTRSDYPQAVGLLGTNLLQGSAWQIDFGKQQLTMLFPGGLAGTSEEPKSAKRVLLQWKNGSLSVQGTLDGKPTEFLLSNAKTVLRSGETLTALQPLRRQQQTQSADGKPDAQASARVQELKIGDIVWKQPVVAIEAGENKKQPNLLGLDLLRRYRITIDPASQSLYLEPDPAYKEVDDSVVGLGFKPHVNADKNMEIISLSLPSPASEAGLKVGDVITSVNGLVVQTTPVQQVAAQVQHKPEGTVITLVVLSKGADKPRTIVLKTRKLL